MKEKKTNGIIELTAKTAFAGLWRNFKEHPIITLGATFQIVGLFLGARFLSGCVKTPKEPVKPPYEQTVPSGEIPSGLPGISSGDITSGEEIPSGEPQLPSGDITSGDVPPSGDIGSGDVEQKPQLPTDIADLSAEQKTALFNAIEEHKATILNRCGITYASVSNTKTIGYDVDLNSKTIKALYKMTRNNEDKYFTVEIQVKGISQSDSSISVEIGNYSLENTIIFKNVENEFSPNAENVYLFFNKVILPDNARFSAYSIDSQGAFDGGYHPLVITNEQHTVNKTIYFNSFNILTDGYNKFTKNSANGARYEEKGGFSFEFGDENTLWRDAIESSN